MGGHQARVLGKSSDNGKGGAEPQEIKPNKKVEFQDDENLENWEFDEELVGKGTSRIQVKVYRIYLLSRTRS